MTVDERKGIEAVRFRCLSFVSIPAAIYCLMAGVLHGNSRPSRWTDGILTVTSVVPVSLLPFLWISGFPNDTVPATLYVLGTIILATQLVREIRTLDLRT